MGRVTFWVYVLRNVGFEDEEKSCFWSIFMNMKKKPDHVKRSFGAYSISPEYAHEYAPTLLALRIRL